MFTSFQLALLILWSARSKFQTAVSATAASLSLVDGLVISALSYFEHQNIRPSTLLLIYLSLSILFDIARVRTLWLLQPEISAVLTASVTIKSLMLVLEAREKRGWSNTEGNSCIGEEDLSGVLNQGFL